ncbi:hypothetical protein SERLADRAFT_438600 [Serpula lacrymans var. lacrymans S7.9]|uniref:Uncharacterized protein n=1 Tax=Serpula lacrymans var. lacrymans (strain S7.9) TaxID=578457 RepID=F8NWC4_SERL9|nr:uncharacterized protein SERLADRAFT_438600 [Serpula lacrymans var. lacrymans S7.9]EGO25003.1 hypothetical protein SERLADRAFT_438600 [Serpula lacrymans var. lacrymans S7.9]
MVQQIADFTLSALQRLIIFLCNQGQAAIHFPTVKILAQILGQQPLPTELMDFYAQLVGILSTLTPADLSALLDKVAPSSMLALVKSNSS